MGTICILNTHSLGYNMNTKHSQAFGTLGYQKLKKKTKNILKTISCKHFFTRKFQMQNQQCEQFVQVKLFFYSIQFMHIPHPLLPSIK